MRLPLPLLSALLLFSPAVLAHRSSSTNSHARRSLDLDPTRRIHYARDSILGDLGLPNLPGVLNPGANTPASVSTDTGSASSTSTTDTTSASSTDSSAASSSSATSLTTTATTDSGSASVSTSAAAAAASSSSSSNDGGLLGLGNVLSSLTSDVISVVTGLPGAVTSILDPTSTSASAASSSAASSSDSGSPTSTDPSSATITAPPSTITSAPASTDSSSSSSSSNGDILSGILNPITSVLSSIVDPITSAASSILDPITSAASSILDPITSAASSVLDPVTSVILVPSSVPSDSATPSSVITDAPASSSAPPDPLSTIISIISSVVLPPASSIDTSVPSSSAAPSSVPDEGPSSSVVVSVPISTPPPSSVPSDVPASSVPVSSSEPVISFPSSSVSAGITTASGVSSAESASITEVPFTTITSISVDPNLSFILTESSLALASVTPSATLTTLTDPDQVTSTVEPIPSQSQGITTALSAALPTGIPARILPSDQLPANTDLSGDTLIAIKLDTTDLNWAFVVSNQISSSQIFAYIPVLISAALGIPGDQIKTFALQVYVPTTYRSAADIQELGTMWLGYIPTELVDQLAAEIKAKQSPFYMGVADPVARSLAQRVDSGFSITSVAPGTVGAGSGNGSGNGSGGAGGTAGGVSGAAGSGDSKERQDAIIGVVSALGAIALLVLVFLVYRSMRHRRQLAHHRLSDPPGMMDVSGGAGAGASSNRGGGGGGAGGNGMEGVRPEGREFDEDSVGGARRRSFYFAEDSLRGYQQPGAERERERQEDAWSNVGGAGAGMSQRRNVVPATISAPILRENTMNW